MPTVLVTGANRGIGREIVEQYGAAGWSVIATCRDPDLADLPCETHALDVGDGAMVRDLVRILDGRPIDLLWNNAGIYPDRGEASRAPDDAVWAEMLRVNSIAPILVARALADNVAQSNRRIMAFTTSRMGSIGGNTSGGAYAYRSSKAALNAAAKSLAIDLGHRHIAVVLVHPGWVRTDMGTAAATLSTEESVAGMKTVLDRIGPAYTGRFINYDGTEIAW